MLTRAVLKDILVYVSYLSLASQVTSPNILIKLFHCDLNGRTVLTRTKFYIVFETGVFTMTFSERSSSEYIFQNQTVT